MITTAHMAITTLAAPLQATGTLGWHAVLCWRCWLTGPFRAIEVPGTTGMKGAAQALEGLTVHSAVPR